MKCRHCGNEVEVRVSCTDVTCNDCLKQIGLASMVRGVPAAPPSCPEPLERPEPLTNVYMEDARIWGLWRLKHGAKAAAIALFVNINKD